MKKVTENELKALSDLPDEKIDTSDIPEVLDWSDAERGRFYRPIKKRVTIRIDADILEWFKRNNPKYQTAINEFLRHHMLDQGNLKMRNIVFFNLGGRSKLDSIG